MRNFSPQGYDRLSLSPMTNRVNLSFLKGKKAQRTWLILVIAWAFIRAILIRNFFGRYGVNPWAYFVVDLTSAIPYAIYSGRAIINFIDKDWADFRKNGLLAAIFFYIPDIYVLIYAKELPSSLLIGFLATIAIFSIFAIFGLRKDVHKGEK
jgi:hypothetical protein